MKIAVFTDTFYPQVNGVVNAIRNFNKMLIARGHVITVYTSGTRPGVSELDGAEVRKYIAFTLPQYPDYEPSPNVIGPAMSAVRFKPDIVHAHTQFMMGYGAWMAARRLGVPLIGTFHTPVEEYVMYVAKRSKMSQRLLKRVAKEYQDWFYKRCDLIIVPAPSAAKYLNVRKKPIVTVSNGLDLSRYGPAGREEIRERFGLGTSPVIMHGGRLSYEKRIEGVIAAMPAVLEKVPDAKLLIVGKGPAQKFLEGKVKDLGIERSVVFTGYVSDEDFPKMFAAADVLAINSPVETQSLIVLEAMATGVPVVGADSGAIPDAVVSGENGYLFKPDDSKALAGHLVKILADDALRAKLKAGALKTASEHSLEKSAEKLLAVYRQALDIRAEKKKRRGLFRVRE